MENSSTSLHHITPYLIHHHISSITPHPPLHPTTPNPPASKTVQINNSINYNWFLLCFWFYNIICNVAHGLNQSEGVFVKRNIFGGVGFVVWIELVPEEPKVVVGVY